jgi:hypothetical protein
MLGLGLGLAVFLSFEGLCEDLGSFEEDSEGMVMSYAA